MSNSIIKKDELTIGRWGIAWQRFMTEKYPNETAKLKENNRWDELAHEIDREAYNL